MQKQTFDSATRPEKIAIIFAWWIAAVTRNPILTAGNGAREAAEFFGIPLNTVRGLQNAAFPQLKPWNEGPSGFEAKANWEVYGIAYVEPKATPAPKSTPASEQDVIPRRKQSGRKPGYASDNPYTVVEGIFTARTPGVAIHTCKRCGQCAAHSHNELVAHFGLRTVHKGTAIEKRSFQAYCRTCKTSARAAERSAQLLRECAELDRLTASGDEAALVAYATSLADKDDVRRAQTRRAVKRHRERARVEAPHKQGMTNGDKRK